MNPQSLSADDEPDQAKQERQEALAGIRAGLRDVEAGREQPLAEAFDDLRKEFNLPPRMTHM